MAGGILQTPHGGCCSVRIGVDLGGGLFNKARLYENLPHLWEQWFFSDRVATRVTRPLHGDSSDVRGAAWLWREEGGP
jgi:fructokinase